MIKRKIGQTAILNRLNRLETVQNSKGQIEVVVLSMEDDGRIGTANIGKGWIYFETMFEAEARLSTLPGISTKTTLLIDDVGMGCDLYLPGEPILYFCNSVERREFIEAALSQERWLPLYINMIQRVLALSIEKPDMPLPGFDDPALQDLIKNKNSMSIEQLIERYSHEENWFEGNKK